MTEATPNQDSLSGIRSEDNRFRGQVRTTYEAFFKQPMTMKELSVLTGIDRANLCRYVQKFRRSNQIAIIKKARCRITGRRVQLLSTNPALFPVVQLNLFDQEKGEGNE